MTERTKGISVALSGGGHRASMFALGSLLYLADAEMNAHVTSIASVSGGSITNGVIAQAATDFTKCSPEELREATQPMANILAMKGTFQGKLGGAKRWLVMAGVLLASAVFIVIGDHLSRIMKYGISLGVATVLSAFLIAPLFGTPLGKVYSVVMVVGAQAALLPFWVFGLPRWLHWPFARPVLFIASLLLWFGALFSRRGWICGQAFRHLLFSTDKGPTLLRHINDGLTHVFCATELQQARHVYFGKGFIFSRDWGCGDPKDLPLYKAVRASSCLPGAFPPMWVPMQPHYPRLPRDPKNPNAARHMVLVDGGVYDNMGDQWGQSLGGRNSRLGQTLGSPVPDELIVVNASAGLNWEPMRRMRIPAIGEILALLKDKSVMYDQTTKLRREALVDQFNLAASKHAGMCGAIVHIAQPPHKVPDAILKRPWSASPSDKMGQRSRDALAALGNDETTRQTWINIAAANSEVGTVLGALSAPVAARLIRHAYVLTMVNLHVLLGEAGRYPLRPIPSQTDLEAWVNK